MPEFHEIRLHISEVSGATYLLKAQGRLIYRTAAEGTNGTLQTVRSAFDPNRISFAYARFQLGEITGRFGQKERADFPEEVKIVSDAS